MEVSELIKAFEDHNDEFLKFDRIPIDRRYSNRPDLNAFMLLDDLLTADNSDMVSAAEHALDAASASGLNSARSNRAWR